MAALNVTSDAEQAVMISLVLVRNSASAQTRCLLKNDCNVTKFAQPRVTSKTSSKALTALFISGSQILRHLKLFNMKMLYYDCKCVDPETVKWVIIGLPQSKTT